MKNWSIYSVALFVCTLISCSHNDDTLFNKISSSHSGIRFRNTLSPTADFNIINYMYYYNGGGVSTADFNNDGLTDIYFTANEESNKLYLNDGNFKFRDVTEDAGVAGLNGWATGVSTVDINADGKLDIYVSYLGDYLVKQGRNQLFINEGNNEMGIPVFRDRSMEYGLDIVAYSTQAAFFDYDLDQDLDLFLLTHSLHLQGTFGKSTLRNNSHPLAGDKLLRNDDGHFVEVTREAGIYNSVLGYGLGVVVSDVNLDGWPDIYVGNDFHENDYLYMNQGNGTFLESAEKMMNHTSRFSMGVDFADINNDAFPDLFSADMLSPDPLILKSSAAEDVYDIYSYKINFGYHHQLARNNLQLNNQDGTFSEIALLSGVAATDWSWSALAADFDLDGYKDLFISNGIPRRVNDLDYINYMNADSLKFRLEKQVLDRDLLLIEKMPQVKIPNYVFRNNRDSTFVNEAKKWGLDDQSYSNGAAYADFDNDGDLDLVTNNVDDESFLYENKTINKSENEKASPHFLQFSFKGTKGNTFGFGAKVLIYSSNGLQMQECQPTRGFQSSVEPRLTFGVAAPPDSVVVIWPTGLSERINIGIDQQLVADETRATRKFDYARFHRQKKLMSKAPPELNIPFKHRENNFVEFNREPLIPHMVSAEGPACSVADVDGDGLDDVFIGGGKWQESAIFKQQRDGSFVRATQPAISQDSVAEDVASAFLDVDGDHDQDLLVVYGGNEFTGKSIYRKPGLYKNDGKGTFTKAPGIPDIFLNGSCIAKHDFDNDGDLDIFIGARSVPWHYGKRPDSYILLNDGTGNFTDKTEEIAPILKGLGLVKSATWVDMNGDERDDLVIASEWDPITILIFENNKLVPLDSKVAGLEHSRGWWNVIVPCDIDQDGDMDLVAGNQGQNSKLQPTVEKPVRMYVSDFDKNDSTDQILTYYMNGQEHVFNTRDEIAKQIPSLKKKYLSYRKFAEAVVEDVFPRAQLDKASVFTADEFRSSIIENLGNGKFRIKPLPRAAQLSTVNAIHVADVNTDGISDLILGGNFNRINIQLGRNDASFGLVCLGNGKGGFTVMPGVRSGFSLPGEIRHIKAVLTGHGVNYLIVRNNDYPMIFTLNP